MVLYGGKYLYELDVINAVKGYLESNGFGIKQVVGKASDHGADLIASSPDGKELWVEAKGQGSSSNTARAGLEFSRNQKVDHVSRALYTACKYVSQGHMAGIALPGDNEHRKIISAIASSIEKLGIVVYFVDPKTKGVTTVR